MKKRILLIMTLATIGLVGCGNQQVFDTTYSFERAVFTLPDGTVIDDEVKSWSDYEGEQIQVKMADGKTYLVNSVNIVLISE